MYTKDPRKLMTKLPLWHLSKAAVELKVIDKVVSQLIRGKDFSTLGNKRYKGCSVVILLKIALSVVS